MKWKSSPLSTVNNHLVPVEHLESAVTEKGNIQIKLPIYNLQFGSEEVTGGKGESILLVLHNLSIFYHPWQTKEFVISSF